MFQASSRFPAFLLKQVPALGFKLHELVFTMDKIRNKCLLKAEEQILEVEWVQRKEKKHESEHSDTDVDIEAKHEGQLELDKQQEE